MKKKKHLILCIAIFNAILIKQEKEKKQSSHANSNKLNFIHN